MVSFGRICVEAARIDNAGIPMDLHGNSMYPKRS